MNTKQIILFSLIISFLASSTMAFELEAKKELKNVVKKEILKEEIKEKKIEEPALSVTSKDLKKENNLPVELTLKEQFFLKIKEAKSEESRKKILSEYKKDLKQEKSTKVQLLEEKSKRIFDRFDSILQKLDSVKTTLDTSILSLEDKKIGLDFIKPKREELNVHLDLAKEEKASAWIKMQEIDFSQDKKIVLSNLIEVKKHLIILKDEVRKTSVNLKEIISFLRGALSNLK